MVFISFFSLSLFLVFTYVLADVSLCCGGADAYKYGDGKKIDGRRVVVDVERGRTVKSWKPRRLGEEL